MRTPFVIAEFASSHDGDLDRMLRGVATAKECDADAFKTWWCSQPERVAERMHAPEHLDAYRVGAWPAGWLPSIAGACKAEGLEFLCTVDCPEDIGVVAPFVDRFKIASWGFGDEDFLQAHRAFKKPIIMSTGVSEQDVWDRIAGNSERHPRTDCALLHCVSGYPTPIEDVNLAVLSWMSWQTDCPVFQGFSDHTRKVMMGALAVAAGARILEVHFCLPDTARDNPDRVVSHEPEALKEYIALARKAAVAMGDGVKRVMDSERANLRHRYVQ